MDELIHSIMEKTGLNQEQAAKAAEASVNFIKGRLPAEVGGQLDKVLGKPEGTLGDLTRKAGSVLGQE